MSKLEQLIADLCPNGVEFKCLEEILNYEQPTKYIVESTNYNDNFTIPVLTAGASFVLGYTDEKEGVYHASPEYPVIIFDDFTTSFHWVDFSFKVKSSAMKILTVKDENEAILRYLYFAMKCIPFEPSQHARHWIQTYSKFRISLPPLPVQQEIVRILDKFTELEAELEAELVARTKQYEYYRDELLSTNQSAVEVKLKEVTKERFWIMPATPNFITEKKVPYITSKNIRKGNINFDNVKYISDEDYKIISNNRPILENDILISMIGTLGEIAIVKKSDLTFYGQNMFLLRLDEKKIDIRFFYHFFDTNQIKEHFKNIKNASSQGYLKAQHIEYFPFPLPPISEQKRIVAILDRFDALVNDVTTGLPAEIAARRKQYEYYRDKLLTFKERQ